jgi:hypothetical protein
VTAIKAVEAEADAAPEGVLVPLTTDEGTVEILIPPPSMWFEGAVDHLTAGRISEWVKLAVEDRESLDLWNSRRKRYRDLDAFLTAWSEAAGESPGKSQASAPSSRSTQRR